MFRSCFEKYQPGSGGITIPARGFRGYRCAETPVPGVFPLVMRTRAAGARLVLIGYSGGAAVLLVDARKGLLAQTRRHAQICALMGVRHVVLAVNKMDLARFEAAVFTQIAEAFTRFAKALAIKTVVAIPVTALGGDNVAKKSRRMRWYRGPTLLAALEAIYPECAEDARFAFPVQWVNRPSAEFRGYAGSVCAGSIRKGETVRVTSSGKVARVARIVTMDGDLKQAHAGAAVSLVLDRELELSRGDVLSRADAPIEMTDQFEATLVWMHDDAGLVGRTYDLKLATQWAGASVTSIKYRLNVETMAHEACATLRLNDICVCNLALSRPVAFDSFERSHALGGFILVDRLSRATVAAGMITHTLRRAQNVHRQALAITATERRALSRPRDRYDEALFACDRRRTEGGIAKHPERAVRVTFTASLDFRPSFLLF